MGDLRSKLLIVLLNVVLNIPSFCQKPNSTKETTVYVFLSETCPICQSYTLPLKEIYSKYKDKQVKIIGIFPNYYSTKEGIDEFRKTYLIPFELILDTDAALTRHFKASITPEVFVESPDKKLLYSGRIDDSFYAIGKRRTVTSTSELLDALNAITSGKPVKNQKTQAVGCIISSSK